jgi:hypothetical protein
MVVIFRYRICASYIRLSKSRIQIRILDKPVVFTVLKEENVVIEPRGDRIAPIPSYMKI